MLRYIYLHTIIQYPPPHGDVPIILNLIINWVKIFDHIAPFAYFPAFLEYEIPKIIYCQEF